MSTEKSKIHFSKSDFARGYQRLAQNVTKYQRDYHEGVDFYKEIDTNHTLMKMGKKTLTGRNQYPDDPVEFKETFLAYVDAMSGVGKAIMHAVAMGLELQEAHFDRAMEDAFWCARVIGYPPLSDAKQADVGVSCGEHTVRHLVLTSFVSSFAKQCLANGVSSAAGTLQDYGNCTILNTVGFFVFSVCIRMMLEPRNDSVLCYWRQDETKNALQVLRKDGEWIYANPIRGYVMCVQSYSNMLHWVYSAFEYQTHAFSNSFPCKMQVLGCEHR